MFEVKEAESRYYFEKTDGNGRATIVFNLEVVPLYMDVLTMAMMTVRTSKLQTDF